MWNTVLTQWKQNRLALLIGQFIVLLLCVMYISYSYIVSILPDSAVKQSFQTTSCFLTSKKLSSRGIFFRNYRADFLISYNVNGVQYNRWVSGNGLDNAYMRNAREQQDLLAQYDVGSTYNCWYDPSNPQLAILVPRHNWVSIFHIILPICIGVITLYYFLKNLFQMLRRGRPVKQKHAKKSKRKRS